MRTTQTLEPVYVTKDYFRGYQDENARYMSDMFYKQNQRIDKMENRFDERFSYIEKRIDFTDQKIDDLKEAMIFSFNHLNEKIDALDQKFTPLLGLLTLIQK